MRATLILPPLPALPPLQIAKVLNVGAGPAGPGGSLGSSVSISLPPPTDALEALAAWKRALLTPPLFPLPPAPPPPAPPNPPPPHHHHHRDGGCCCGRGRSSSSDSSAASSEEDLVGSEDARLQRCVRTVAPNMLVDGTYAHVAQVCLCLFRCHAGSLELRAQQSIVLLSQMDACAARGMQMLAGGAAPADARDAIAACMAAADPPFPPPLAPFVQDFNDCVARVLT